MFYTNYLALCFKVGKAPSNVAKELGISKSAVSKWKKGGTPSDATLFKLSQYFNCSIENLKKDENEKSLATQQDDEANAMIGFLLSNFMRLSQDQQRMIVQQIQALSLLQSNQGDE